MVPEFKLVTYTALAIIAEEGIGPLQQIRQKNDPAFERWPPHINLFFPFVEPESFNIVHDSLTEAFKDFEEFEITFTQFDSFPHGTIFLLPDVVEKKIHQVYEIIANKHPEFKDKKHKEFNPHMTAAKVKKHEIENKKAEFQATWQEWKIKCKGLHMIARDKNTPFKTIKFVQFKKQGE